jgi:hypothetical protein
MKRATITLILLAGCPAPTPEPTKMETSTDTSTDTESESTGEDPCDWCPLLDVGPDHYSDSGESND